MLETILESDGTAEHQTAFNLFYERYEKKVFNRIYINVKDYPAAQDIAQQVWLDFFRADSGRMDNPEKFLFGIVRNKILEYRRSLARRKRVLVNWPENSAFIGKTPEPVNVVLRREKENWLRTRVIELRGVGGEVMRMMYLGGLGYDEIINKLQKTRSAVESALCKARKKLRKEWEEI